MSLKLKFLFCIGLALILQIILLLSIQKYFISPKLFALEKENTMIGLQKHISILFGELNSLVLVSSTLSHPQLLQPSRKDGFLNNPNTARWMTHNHIDYLYIIAPDGQLIGHQASSTLGNTLSPAVLYNELSAYSIPYLQTEHNTQTKAGFIPSRHGILLTTFSPLLNQHEQSLGTLVLIKKLDQSLQDHLPGQLNAQFKIWPLAQENIPKKELKILQRFQTQHAAGQKFFETISEFNDKKMTIYNVIEDIFNEPSLLLAYTTPRQTFYLFELLVKSFMLISIMAASFNAGLIIYYYHKDIISSIRKVRAQIKKFQEHPKAVVPIQSSKQLLQTNSQDLNKLNKQYQEDAVHIEENDIYIP